MLWALLSSMTGLLMVCDLLDVIFKIHSLNLSKDAYFHLINVLNVVLGCWPSVREESMLPCKKSLQEVSLLSTLVKKLPKPMKSFGNFSVFKIVIPVQSIRWNLSTLSNPSSVLLKPMDMLRPAPNRAEWKLQCLNTFCFRFCSFISSSAGCSGRNVISGYAHWTRWDRWRLNAFLFSLGHLYPIVLDFFPKAVLKKEILDSGTDWRIFEVSVLCRCGLLFHMSVLFTIAMIWILN